MNIVKLTCEPNCKYITVTLGYDEIRDIANGLYYTVKETENGSKYKEIQGKCKFLFDMVKHGSIQPETVEMLTKSILTDEEIDCFNAYLELEKVDAFGNTDWNNIYYKIVGNKVSDYAERKMNKALEDL